MPELYIVREIHETLRGLYGTVALPDGRVWVMDGKVLAEGAHGAVPIERAMTVDDVDVLLDLGIIDIECARRQVVRVLV